MHSVWKSSCLKMLQLLARRHTLSHSGQEGYAFHMEDGGTMPTEDIVYFILQCISMCNLVKSKPQEATTSLAK